MSLRSRFASAHKLALELKTLWQEIAAEWSKEYPRGTVMHYNTRRVTVAGDAQVADGCAGDILVRVNFTSRQWLFVDVEALTSDEEKAENVRAEMADE